MLVIFVKLKAWLNNSVWAIAFNLAFWSVKGLKFKCHTSAKFWYISWFKIAYLDFSANQWSICLLALAFSIEIHFFLCAHVQILGRVWFAGSLVASFFLCFSFKIRVKVGRLRWIMDRLTRGYGNSTAMTQCTVIWEVSAWATWLGVSKQRPQFIS